MAESIEVGNLVVRLIADAKQLETALSKGGADLKKFGDQATDAGKRVKAANDSTITAVNAVVGRIGAMVAAYASVTSVIQAFNQHVANVSALDNLSQATGISIERLSELRNIALATGVDINVLQQAMTQFGGRMTEGLASPTSRVSQAIRSLGIEVRDASGNLRSFEDVLGQVAERFPGYADGANKAAIASALFGEEAGPRMVALLNRGRAGLEEMRRTLGATITAADVEAVRGYNRAVAELQVTMDRLLIPSLTRAVQMLTALARIPVNVADAFAAVSPQVSAVQARMDALNRELERHRQLNAEGRETDERFAEVQRRINAELERQAQLLRELNRDRIGPFQTTVTPGNQAPAMDPHALERAQMALDRIMDRLQGQRDIFDPINLSWQEHANVVQQAIEAIGRAHETQHRREHALHQLNLMMRRQEQQAMLSTATLAASTIQALWPKQKGAAIAAAVINTAVGITRALAELPPPWSWAQAALIAASGAAQIASIKSTNETGSSGGTPTAPVADATPGRALTIQGVDPGHIFSGSQLRGLIEMINDEVRNGATLISTGNLGT